jgi:hypothetical protein
VGRPAAVWAAAVGSSFARAERSGTRRVASFRRRPRPLPYFPMNLASCVNRFEGNGEHRNPAT